MTRIILNDFPNGKRITTELSSKEMDLIKRVWDKGDKILHDMQEHPAFAGRETWSDLDPKHLTIMLTVILRSAAKLENSVRSDADNKVISSLHFLYGVLIMCIQTRSECIVELIRINRFSDSDITYDFTATHNIFDGIEVAPSKIDIKFDGLKLIIDNEEGMDGDNEDDDE